MLSTRRQRPTWGYRDDGKRPHQAGADNRSNLAKSVDLLTVCWISVVLAANAPRERRKGYSVRSDGGAGQMWAVLYDDGTSLTTVSEPIAHSLDRKSVV